MKKQSARNSTFGGKLPSMQESMKTDNPSTLFVIGHSLSVRGSIKAHNISTWLKISDLSCLSLLGWYVVCQFFLIKVSRGCKLLLRMKTLNSLKNLITHPQRHESCFSRPVQLRWWEGTSCAEHMSWCDLWFDTTAPCTFLIRRDCTNTNEQSGFTQTRFLHFVISAKCMLACF